jgi:hypothetical protein
MKSYNVLIIGSGKRVQETIIPALACIRDVYNIVGIYSRTKKIVAGINGVSTMTTTTDLSIFDFSIINIIVIAVTTEHVGSVLQLLSRQSVSNTVLFLDTPVLHHTQLFALKYFSRFKRVYVSEDYIGMANIRIMARLIHEGHVGRLRKIYLFHNGYKYHAFAMLKKLVCEQYILKVTLQKFDDSSYEYNIRFSKGVSATIVGPKDYECGRILIVGDRGCISDYKLNVPNNTLLSYRYAGKIYSGIDTTGAVNERYRVNNKFYPAVMRALSETSLIRSLKIEGMITLLKHATENSPRVCYTPQMGLYDYLVSVLVDKLGWFRDYKLFFTSQSVFQFLIQSLIWLSRICES